MKKKEKQALMRALWQFDTDYYWEKGEKESKACREAPMKLRKALVRLLESL